MKTISIGRTVLYKLSEQDAEQINRRRTHGGKIAELIAKDKWPEGAQAHIGNSVQAGDVYPAVAVRIFVAKDQQPTPETPVNLKVFLDGSDDYWATSRIEGTLPGTWSWPEIK